MIRPFAAALAVFVVWPAWAGAGEPLRLLCRADNPALLAAPLGFSIDLDGGRAVEVGSGGRYGVTAQDDGLELWQAGGDPRSVVFRIDRLSGRFARLDKQLRLEGACEKTERRF
ncbi:MAG: hypothetical protein NVV74_06565 [Magnetospirillum sp.]|nr:hypothetical protein [Magnetospirillum sp.]